MDGTREPSPATARHLARLYRRHLNAVAAEQAAKDALAVAVWNAYDQKEASMRGIALTLGVSPATVSAWAARGKQLAETRG